MGIPSIPKINRLLTSVSGLASTDPAAAYIAAITATGATVTPTQRSAINTFITTGETEGWYALLKRFYLPIWQVAGANAICLKSLTSGTFVGDVTHTVGGAYSGYTGYMNTNVNILGLGIASSYHYSVLFVNNIGEGYDAPFGTVQDVYFFSDDGNFACQIEDVTIDMRVFAESSGFGITTLGGNQFDRYVKNRTTSGVATITDTQDFELLSYPSNNNIFFLARNAGSNSPNATYNNTLGAFGIASELTNSQDTAYTLALKTLWETTTGLTLL